MIGVDNLTLLCSASFLTKTIDINDTTCKFALWDTAGQEKVCQSLPRLSHVGDQPDLVHYTHFHLFPDHLVWLLMT
jgi:hypothetical protein